MGLAGDLAQATQEPKPPTESTCGRKLTQELKLATVLFIQLDTMAASPTNTVRIDRLSFGSTVEIKDSAFFTEARGELPAPAAIRRKATENSDGYPSGSDRPPPVIFSELGVLVKYGTAINIAEAQCLWYFNKHLQGRVPTPEVYGWCQDEDETFIYMQLLPGITLDEAWPRMSQAQRDSVCGQLRDCVQAWRGLRQETGPPFVGKMQIIQPP